MAKYTAIFQQAADGTWSGYVPDLPAILAMGDTLVLATKDMRSVIDVWMEDMKKVGLPIPPPSTQVASIEVKV